MTLILLELGTSGEPVERWQLFLIGKEILKCVADGRFGLRTSDATKAYQTLNGLTPDGRVGSKTYARALEDGFDGVLAELDYPLKPPFPPLLGTTEREVLFGHFDYIAKPTPSNPEAIEVSRSWKRDNIMQIALPGLQTVAGAPSNSKMTFHRIAAPQLSGLWNAWEANDLIPLILTYGGSYVPRFIRGSRTVLSNHAFGSAFDINVAWNFLGHNPAPASQKGSVRPLVPIANDYGFYWGGHFNTRKDGMHLEVAKILSTDELSYANSKYGTANS